MYKAPLIAKLIVRTNSIPASNSEKGKHPWTVQRMKDDSRGGLQEVSKVMADIPIGTAQTVVSVKMQHIFKMIKKTGFNRGCGSRKIVLMQILTINLQYKNQNVTQFINQSIIVSHWG